MPPKAKQEPIQVPKGFNPRPYQLQVLQALDGVEGHPETRKKRALLRWARRAGKDLCCFAYMVKEAARAPGNYFYIFPTAAQAKKALWNKVVDTESGMKALDYIPKELLDGKPNSQELLIRFNNNSTIQLVGLDKNEDSIRGVSCHGAVLSEFAFQDPEAYKPLMPSIREADGWLIINSTPNGRNHMYEMERRVINSTQWYVSSLQTLWPDKPNYYELVSPEGLQEVQQLEGYDDDEMEREYGVAYNTGMKGSYYIDYINKARTENRIGMYPAIPNLPVMTFWDLGYNDETFIVFAQIHQGTIRIVDYIEDSQRPWDHYVSAIVDKGYIVGDMYLPHDGMHKTGQTALTNQRIIQNACDLLNLRARVNSVRKLPTSHGINAVKRAFHKIVFNEPQCFELIEMLGLYHKKWDKKKQAYLKEPVHDWTSHCADAVRTLAVAVEEYMLDSPYRHRQDIIKADTDYNIFN